MEDWEWIQWHYRDDLIMVDCGYMGLWLGTPAMYLTV